MAAELNDAHPKVVPNRPPNAVATTRFINVDLDLVSRRDLTPLVDALSRWMDVLHHARVGRTFHATLELGGRWSHAPAAPDRIIRRMVQLVEGLPHALRADWDNATARRFDLGFESGETRLHPLELKASTVSAVACVRGSIVLTVYPCARAGELLPTSDADEARV